MLIELKDFPLELQLIINIIYPLIYNIKIRPRRPYNYFCIDYYFEDDPQKDEIGYLGHSIEEFKKDSSTYKRLSLIGWLIQLLYPEKFNLL